MTLKLYSEKKTLKIKVKLKSFLLKKSCSFLPLTFYNFILFSILFYFILFRIILI